MSLRTYGALAAATALVSACSSSPSSPSPKHGFASITVDDYPQVAAIVVFHHPDGTVQASSIIDPGVTARADVVPGSLVTVARNYNGGWVLSTIAGLEPDDAIRLEPPAAAGRYLAGTAALALPQCSGASRYRVDIGCSSSEWTTSVTDPVSVLIYEPVCGSTVDVLATALDPNDVPSAYAATYDVPVSGALASAVVGPWEPAAMTSIALTNAPPGAVDVRVMLEPQRHGVRFDSSVAGAWTQLTGGGPVTQTFAYPGGFATSARRSVVVDFSTDRPVQQSGQIVGEVSYAPATIDLAATLLPRLSNLRVTSSTGQLDAGWDEAAADASLDGITLTASWSTVSGYHSWNVLMPPGVTSFAFPTLPAVLAGSLPPDGAIFGTVTTWDAADTASYRAFRHQHTGFLYGISDTGASTLRYASAWAW